MAQENTGDQAPANTMPPGGLPVVGEKKLFTHTMQEDVARAKTDPASFIKEQEAQKPFSQFIPPAPLPNGGFSADKFREVIEPIPDRDQPFPLPETNMEAPTATPQFQVRIPSQKSGLSTTTIILVVVLLLLIGGGAAGYWWFFMRTPQSEVVVQIPEKPAPTPQPIIPEPIPTPAPQPEPLPIPEPIPAPQPVEEIATTTPAIEPVATTTPPIVEPVVVPVPTPVVPPAPIEQIAAPEAALALDHTITITLSQINKAEAIEKLTAENAKITDGTTTIRYIFTLATPTGQTYLSSADVAGMLGITPPQSITSLATRTDLIGYKNAGTVRYGLASAISNKTAVKSAALAWEKTMLTDLTGLYIEKMYENPETSVFSTNTYLTFYKRYLNMPQPETSLDWATSNTHFIIATSKDMIFAILDKAAQAKK